MSVTVVRRRTAVAPRPDPPPVPASRAVDHQLVVHRLLRRELPLLADLVTWAPPDEAARTAMLTRHADLLGRVLRTHLALERELLWPALLHALPADAAATTRALLDGWDARCAVVDAALRGVGTSGRQWAVARSPRARDAFALACLDLAAAVEVHTAAEERDLLPRVAACLPAAAWTAITRAARPGLSGRERLLVLGLALEDASPAERARLLAGVGRGTRVLWRLVGRGRHRAAVVRLRGAPPAA
ncbi:hemerythrin domain-containing protein [Geodermatophilus maliterrae]|uniref:Hemerythrin domain-containing protein n=1 Tax=Geodermatophilus maliterrae TaxID=3162531 RepID=A0ABV3XDR9_9ACTN